MNDVIRLVEAFDFAARKHVDQKRKGSAEEPYVNHVAEVAKLLAGATEGKDANLVIAGLLHDTLEDTPTTYEELVEKFGEDIARLVQEVTDDKALPKDVRKRLQVETAHKKTNRAKMLKIADKIANLHSLASSPPSDWPPDRRQEYVQWSADVVAGCRGVNASLERTFDLAVQRLGTGT